VTATNLFVAISFLFIANVGLDLAGRLLDLSFQLTRVIASHLGNAFFDGALDLLACAIRLVAIHLISPILHTQIQRGASALVAQDALEADYGFAKGRCPSEIRLHLPSNFEFA